jgi:uncharacterized membrane protein YedE/YeeE
MICSFSHGLCFVELLVSALLLGIGFAAGTTLWRLVTKA